MLRTVTARPRPSRDENPPRATESRASRGFDRFRFAPSAFERRVAPEIHQARALLSGRMVSPGALSPAIEYPKS